MRIGVGYWEIKRVTVSSREKANEWLKDNGGEPMELVFDAGKASGAIDCYYLTVKIFNNGLCAQCGSNTGLKYPNGQEPYCEDCGWPDEDRGKEATK